MKSGKLTTFNRRALHTALASAAALAGVGLAVNADAANNASATASARVVAAISNVKSADLQFGKFLPGGTSGTVVISNSGAASKTGGVTLLTTTTSAAKFDITGETSATYSISYAGTSTSLSDGNSHTMGLSLTSNLTGTNDSNPTVTSGTLSGDNPGVQSIYVGGSLAVAANQAAGTYTGTVSVTVDYN